jgi:hypothetical protein
MSIDFDLAAFHRVARARRAETVYRLLLRPIVALLNRAAE